MALRFKNMTGLYIVEAAAKRACELIDHDSPMMCEISRKDDFEFGAGSGVNACSRLIKCEKVLPIFLWSPWWIWTKALGYFDGQAIHLNKRKVNNLSDAQLVGLLCHEYSHAAGFTHGNNYKTEFKCKHSVPYFLSENIERWL